VQPVTTITLPFDVVFLSPAEALVSASPTGASTAIVHLNVTTGATRPIATLSGPSGPVGLDASGNLYYVTSTFEFPAPPGSHTLLRFGQTAVAQAIKGARVLTEADGQAIASLDSGFGMAITKRGDFFVTNLFGAVEHVTPQGTVKPFAQTLDGGFALFTYTALFEQTGVFSPNARNKSARLAVMVDDLSGHPQVMLIRPVRRVK
jgi:hypothetical protein